MFNDNLEPQTTIYKWLFQLDDSKSLYRKWLFHQTSIYKWLFGVPGNNTIIPLNLKRLHFFGLRWLRMLSLFDLFGVIGLLQKGNGGGKLRNGNFLARLCLWGKVHQLICQVLLRLPFFWTCKPNNEKTPVHPIKPGQWQDPYVMAYCESPIKLVSIISLFLSLNNQEDPFSSYHIITFKRNSAHRIPTLPRWTICPHPSSAPQ